MPDAENAPTGEVLPGEVQRLVLGAYVLRLFAEANGGEEPENIWQYRRVGRRLGLRIRVLPGDVLPSSLLRQGQQAGQQGVIYVRRTHDMAKLRVEILHELAEAATRWEGVPPCVTACSRHEVARRTEDLCFRRIG